MTDYSAPPAGQGVLGQETVSFMEKRVLIAVVLSFLVLYGYQALFVKPAPPSKARTTAGST